MRLYYFEVTNPLESPDQNEYYKYEDIVVKLKSNYGSFTEDGFEFNQNIISKNYIYQTMPLVQQLANGGCSKYLAHKVTNLDDEIKKLYDTYGSGDIEFDSYNDNITNKGQFKFQTASYVSEILVSAISGFETWELIITN